MATIQVFDKPMCCSTGICGPEVDPALVTLAADLQWLERHGVQVQRINPAHQPSLFATSELVREELKKHGNSCLPLIVVSNGVVSRGVIPNRTQLADWAGISLDKLTVIKSGCCRDAASRTGTLSSCCEQV